MPKRQKEKVDIDVVPYLSIMVIVLKLICLILIVTVMRIALNPHGVKAVAIENLYGVERKGKDKSAIKAPTYFDCSRDGIRIIPGDIEIPISDLATRVNPVTQAIDQISADSSNQYAIVLVRPGAVKAYRHVRKLLYERDVDVGYDVIDLGVEVNYRKAARASGIEM